MKKKVLAVAIASALVAPSAFAAEDDLGMRYTSAAEGFYGSLRTEFVSNDQETDTDSLLDDSTSRLGVQGTNDLGGGLEGFYRYEFSVGRDNGGDPLKTRLRYVGLRGSFGDIRFGSVWDDTYNYTFSKSDKSPNDSGRYAWYFRNNQVIQYNTPDLNGFQGSIRASVGTTDDGENENNDNAVDAWALNAQYGVAGFNASGTYETVTDGLGPVEFITALGSDGEIGGQGTASDTKLTLAPAEDMGRWAVGLSYGQDNWNVGGWYGVQETNQAASVAEANDGISSTDDPAANNNGNDDVATVLRNADGDPTSANITNHDIESFSIGADVTVDKVVLFALFEQQKNVKGREGVEDSATNVGVIYKIGSRSRVWVEYVSQDLDSSTKEDDYINIGMRHDF